MTTLAPELQPMARQASALLAWLSIELDAHARSLGVAQVLFMTREGLLFKPYFERFQAARGAAVPGAELLQVSRLSTFAASLHGQGAEGLARLFSQYPQAGTAQLLASLGEPGIWPGPSMAACGEALGQLVAGTPALRAWLAEVAARRHAELSAYLQAAHAHIQRDGRALVVDIGWRGTIQDNLALALPGVRWEGVYIGLYPFMNPQPANAVKRALLFDAVSSARMPGDNLMPIEYLFHQAVGTVAGYQEGQPRTLGREADDPVSTAFQAAVLEDAAARAAQWQAVPDESTLVSWRQEAMDFWRNCQQMPLPLFQALCRYRHEETFGLGQVVNMADAVSPRAALRSLASRRDRALFLQYVAALPLGLRQEPGLGPWLRAWLYLRHVLRRLRSSVGQ